MRGLEKGAGFKSSRRRWQKGANLGDAASPRWVQFSQQLPNSSKELSEQMVALENGWGLGRQREGEKEKAATRRHWVLEAGLAFCLLCYPWAGEQTGRGVGR